MNFPSFPTDNLYKFLVIAGLVLAGYSASYGYNHYIELELQVLRNATEERILRIEQTQLLDRVNRMKAKKDRGELSDEEFEQTVRDTKDPFIQGERVLGKANETALLYRRFADYLYFLYAGLYGGLIMTFFGFVMWYFKIQRPSDAIMKKRASE